MWGMHMHGRAEVPLILLHTLVPAWFLCSWCAQLSAALDSRTAVSPTCIPCRARGCKCLDLFTCCSDRVCADDLSTDLDVKNMSHADATSKEC